MTLHFTVPGVPVGKGRPRVTKHGTYTPPKTKAYESLVRLSSRSCGSFQPFPEGVALSVLLIARFPVPKRYTKLQKAELPGKPYLHKPDSDNVEKAVCDACNGLLWADDSQVSTTMTLRRYTDGGGDASVWVTDEGIAAILTLEEVAQCL